MLCEFKRVIYPSVPSPGSYMVALYHPCEQVKDLAGNVLEQIKAVGYCLPTAENLRFDMQGRWKTNAKFGVQFEVESYDEVLVPTKEGVIGYLASGQIKGIGQKTAEKIYDLFGLQTLDVLDKEPEKLLQIKGITEKKLQKIRESYLMNRGARDIIAFLAPHGITPRQALKFYEEYAERTMQTRENLALQELNYRISVLETFQAFAKGAPMGMKVEDLSYHYQLVDTYVKSVLGERQFGAKTDSDGKKRRETAHQSLEKVVQAGRKQFSSFSPSKPEQYSQAVGKYINALLPVWMQYRDTYINLQEVLKSGQQ